MPIKQKSTKIFVITVVGTFIAFLLFLKSPYFGQLQLWAQKHTVLYVVLLLSIKIAGIIWPPIPGGTLTLASAPLIGWKQAYIIDLIGSTVGSSAAYVLGKKYGEAFIRRIISSEAVEEMKKFKIVKGKEPETIFMLRMTVGQSASELLAYGAGFLKLKYKTFFLSTTIAHAVLGIPMYYLTETWVHTKSWIPALFIAIILLPILIKFRTKSAAILILSPRFLF